MHFIPRKTRLTFAGCLLMALSACLEPATTSINEPRSASQNPQPAGETFLLSWGMFGDPVFDRDVQTFSQAYERAFGAPDEMALYGANAPGLRESDFTAVAAEVSRMANAAEDGRDLVVIMLSSHGGPDVIAVQFERDGPVAVLSANGLAELLKPLENDRVILIIQACYSGSLIDELSSRNRIILTAAAADRTSFGCDPQSENTWFIKALNEALNQGGSWAQIFAGTRARVQAQEAAQGMPSSDPQSFVGANMRQIWNTPEG